MKKNNTDVTTKNGSAQEDSDMKDNLLQDNPEVEILEINKKEFDDLKNQIAEAKGKEQRALADYQNLVRRTREEKIKIIKLAAKDFIAELIQPLGNLALASKQLDDAGLNMVIAQFWQVLENNGLKKIEAMGKKFDIDLMEAVEKGKKGERVVDVVKDGYLLNDEVIQHSKVVLD